MDRVVLKDALTVAKAFAKRSFPDMVYLNEFILIMENIFFNQLVKTIEIMFHIDFKYHCANHFQSANLVEKRKQTSSRQNVWIG